ncbi:MAG: hypothetical protein LBR14_01610 [Clostridiales Family XIII bacterium]|jgi:HPt (histidine-containing phosphotransfer) domain-containing protein|nr:hypothetical protein [Clostridiales Family XIII bacterium]
MGNADSKYIDVASALARVGGNEGLYRKLLEKFETSVDIAGFDQAISEKNYTRAGEIVHAAKGIAGNLSLTGFFQESSVLMEQLRGGGTPQQENVDLFRKLYEETKVAVRAYLA